MELKLNYRQEKNQYKLLFKIMLVVNLMKLQKN